MPTNANSVPQIALNDGAAIPQLGFGVWKIPRNDAAAVIGEALDTGYRHIDTAQLCGNEQGHPWFAQVPLVAANRRLGVQVEGWSPLANGRLLEEPSLQQIAAEHGRTVAQVVIRWHLQLGYVVIPKSVTPARIATNFDVFDFELSPGQLERIGAVNRDRRIGQNPDDF
jgi:2,5-diketo-D-gluconate reductase A